MPTGDHQAWAGVDAMRGADAVAQSTTGNAARRSADANLSTIAKSPSCDRPQMAGTMASKRQFRDDEPASIFHTDVNYTQWPGIQKPSQV
jgi:hypothetical protein